MILFDTDVVIIRYWGTKKERDFIDSLIKDCRNRTEEIGITTFIKGELYRTMLDALVFSYNIFLKKLEDVNDQNNLN